MENVKILEEDNKRSAEFPILYTVDKSYKEENDNEIFNDHSLWNDFDLYLCDNDADEEDLVGATADYTQDNPNILKRVSDAIE